MNLTLSLDEDTVARAREVAKASGKSLNQLVREYIQSLAGTPDPEVTIARLHELWAEAGGDSKGQKICRDDAYDRAIFLR
jgi:hypothetical protein